MWDHKRRLGTIAASFAASVGLSAFGAGPALAQAEPADLCKNGQIVAVRVSRIVEGGSRTGFDKAVADQLAWYRSHGFAANRLVTADVIVQDPRTKAWSVSSTEVMSLHINPPAIGAIKTDATWNAFVSEFKANAVVDAERTACLAQHLAGGG
jgi:hypothetical protein